MNRSLAFLFAASCLAVAVSAGADNSRDIIQELDENGVDPPAITRRLTKTTTILDKAQNRLDALLVAYPPGPTYPPGPSIPERAAINTALDGIIAQADAVAAAAQALKIAPPPDQSP